MQNILVCHTGAWIGDMVLVTPALRSLKHTYKESYITFFLRKQAAQLMQANPYIDKCIVDTKQKSGIKSFMKLIGNIKRDAYDIAIVLHPTSIRNALIPFIARIPVRVGANYNGRGLFLTQSLTDNKKQHEIKRYLNVISLLNNNTTIAKNNTDTSTYQLSQNLEFWHTETERETVRNILQSYGISQKHKLIAINIGTTWKTKQWDIGNFRDVINRISTFHQNIKFIIIGSNAEKPILNRITLPNNTINLVGKTNLLELGALLERCDVCITCDSGPMHIAAAVGTPTIALFGPTDPSRHKPYGDGHTIVQKSVNCRPCYKRSCHRQDELYRCMTEIKTTDVTNAALTKLNQIGLN